jgi:zinc transporter ZupT
MSKNGNNGTSKSSLIILIGYLISSIFAGLIFSGLTMRTRNSGKSVFGWALLSMICIVGFGYIGYALYKSSSPEKDVFYYYLGIVTLAANGFALLILILSIFKRN